MPLYSEYQKIKSDHPQMRMVDAAKQLNVSEAELLQSCVGNGTVRLNNDFGGILKSLKQLGKVMALARNAEVVTEISGNYEKVYVQNENDRLKGIAINPGGIDLRFFFDHWHSAFATQVGALKSIQFFDKYGDAIQKIYLKNTESDNVYNDIVNKYKNDNQSTPLVLSTPPQVTDTSLADNEVDVAKLESAWEKMTDVHQFPALLKAHNVSRHQAMKLISDKWSKEVSPNCLDSLLQQAKSGKEEIMAFVGNKGIVQIFSGRVNLLKPMGDWFNVLDPDFNLHVNTKGLQKAYIVHKPTDNGDVTVSSVEFLNDKNETVLTFFGSRTEGKVQTEGWKRIINTLLSDNTLAA
ncbi:ChuX/HutX family heme-like substrate-binding protein [Alteromonas sp. KUL49]|uniref:hemin-degrading factor n=1 Tax=Alteromonas sp. KUL49 TaxID=2480798 RepID=UPI00102EEC04|nr:ChuX/HutX family heme-like substrate-binding protein [Alteromonas sp. KUL49]TAP40116.1 hemin-degrading factor [Alteromonas sp. KUL49]GEA11229.1 hemin-degrading factor [Alteromonas sp. KUL49]